MENLVEKDSRLEQLRNLAIDEDLGHSERQFQAKKRHAISLVSDQLYNEAEELLNSLLELKPQDQELIELNKKLQYEKAVQVINRQTMSNQSQLKLPLFPWKSTEALQETEEIESSIDQLLHFQRQKPEWSFDVAVALFCIGHMDKALEILEQIEDPRSFWLKIDIYLETRRFVQAIDEIENYKIDPSHNNFEEQNFSLLFLKAKAHWGAGQKDLALSHMEQIIKVRPDYRIAESLYQYWKAEAEQ
jgi:predicted Zn-dependent protease